MSDGGKGSGRRPSFIDPAVEQNNWDRIFGKKKKTDAEKFDEAVMKNEYYDVDIDPDNIDGDPK